jgi:CO dehydrogenase maturation factor
VLKALMQHLLLRIDGDVILDMEAGLEHVGRASARGADAMISVVEPGMRSVQTAARIHRLAKDIGIVDTFAVANKIREAHEFEVLRQALEGQEIIGALPYSPALARADLEGREIGRDDRRWIEAVGQIVQVVQKRIDSKATGDQTAGPAG